MTISNKGKTAIIIGGTAGLAGLSAFLLNRKPAKASGPSQSVVMLKWGENGETGPQTIVMNTSQLLVVSVTNPTNRQWTYNLQWLLGREIGAEWENITVDPGQTIELQAEIQFNSGYIVGDANGDGVIDVGDIAYIIQVLDENPAFPVTPGCDANQDGIITIGDRTAIERILMKLDPIIHEGGIVIGGTRAYTSKIKAIEINTGVEFSFPFDAITIVDGAGIVNLFYPPELSDIEILVSPAEQNNFSSYGNNPASLDLSPGMYDLIARKAGYIDYTTQFTVVLNEEVNIQVTMNPAIALINFTYEQEGVEVFFTEERIGINPASIQVEPGHYMIRALKQWHYGFIQQLYIEAGQTVNVHIALVRATGHIYVEAKDRDTGAMLAANVEITGEFSKSGIAPLYWDDAPLGIAYLVNISLNDYTSYSQEVMVTDPNIQVNIHAQLVSTVQPNLSVNLKWPDPEAPPPPPPSPWYEVGDVLFWVRRNQTVTITIRGDGYYFIRYLSNPNDPHSGYTESFRRWTEVDNNPDFILQ